ncbi:MAG: TIGR00282 family metallophosphoesterase [Candidatus Sumerlaeia bacterium]|nr:TIGR00282 family metallophosphoesterase [Candidatus Sumerlaeia bacterium]
MNVLFVGDIFGRPGRTAIRRLLPALRNELEVDLVIANCENSAGGKGVTESIGRELFEAGCDLLTGGNHIFAQRGSEDFIEAEERLVRPLNYPPGAPGRGWMIHESQAGPLVGVINACGRSFMGPHYDDPFRAIDMALEEIRPQTTIVFVDFHAETTSEKVAMGWYLDGRVTAVLGTHTHIPTADERLLHKGTAYITDTGMTGPYDSIIGDSKESILEALLTQRPKRFEVAEAREVSLNGVLISVDTNNGAATSIRRIRREL